MELTILLLARNICLKSVSTVFKYFHSARRRSHLALSSSGPTEANQGDGGRFDIRRWVAGACWSRISWRRVWSSSPEREVDAISLCCRSSLKEGRSTEEMSLASVQIGAGTRRKTLSVQMMQWWSETSRVKSGLMVWSRWSSWHVRTKSNSPEAARS